MTGTEFRVRPAGDRWRLEQDGEQLSEHATQDEAVSVARQRATAAAPAEVIVCGADGQIQASSSYNDKPFDRVRRNDTDTPVDRVYRTATTEGRTDG